MNVEPRRRVVVAVEPPLLADALTRALATMEGLDVTLHLEGRTLEIGGGEYDIALVSESLGMKFRARAVIRLPAEPGAGTGMVEVGTDRRSFDFAGLTDVTDLIVSLVSD